MLASLALSVQGLSGASAENAAEAAAAELNAWNKANKKSQPIFPLPEIAVERVVREMTKQRNDPSRRLHFDPLIALRALTHLPA